MIGPFKSKQSDDGRFFPARDITLAAAASRTTSSNGSAVDVGGAHTLRLALVCSSRSGTSPTLDVKVQTSPDGTNWYDVAAFAQITAAGTSYKSFSGLDRYVRAAWTIGGSSTPTFAFSVAGELVGQ